MLLDTATNIAPSPSGIWLNRHFLHWWLLPSVHAHASHLPGLLADAITPLPGPDAPAYAALHQHWSAQLLARHPTDTDTLHAITTHPALPLCMAPAALRTQWLQHAGMLLASPQLRRCIDRTSRLQVQRSLGDGALAWAVQVAPQLHPGVPELRTLQWQGWDLAESMQWLGAQLLWTALEDAPATLRERVRWQQPAQWAAVEHPNATRTSAAHSSATWPSAPAAQAIGLELMNTLDSTWLSSLPKTH